MEPRSASSKPWTLALCVGWTLVTTSSMFVAFCLCTWVSDVAWRAPRPAPGGGFHRGGQGYASAGGVLWVLIALAVVVAVGGLAIVRMARARRSRRATFDSF